MTTYSFRLLALGFLACVMLGSSINSAQTMHPQRPARVHSSRTPFGASSGGIRKRAGIPARSVSPLVSPFALRHDLPAAAPGGPLTTSSIFFAPTLYDAALRAQSSVAADINGDGKLDLITASPCDDLSCLNGLVSVSLGNGDGSFQPALSYSSIAAAAAEAVGDLNGDSRPDLVVAVQCNYWTSEGCVAVLLGNGDGSFQTPVTYSSGGQSAVSVALADLNGDGKVDVVVANQFPDYISNTGVVAVLLGNGDGTLGSPVKYSSGGTSTIRVAIGDLNGDQKLDLLVSNECAYSSCMIASEAVLLGNGDGTFQPPSSYTTGCANTDDAALADLNGDSKLDVVVVTEANCSSVLMGNGDGSLGSPINLNSGRIGMSVAVADVNNDGKADLAVANAPASVSLELGNGDGTFQPPVTYASGGAASSALVGDMNSDGAPDLVVTNQCVGATCQSGSIAVLLGKGDGTFEGLLGQAPGEDEEIVAVGDVNGDGEADLIIADQCFSPTCDQNAVRVLLGKGDATFQISASYATGGMWALATAIADVNGDNKLDIVVASANSAYSAGGILSVLLGNGDGSFHPALTLESGGDGASWVDVADVNGDGKADLIAANICVSWMDCNVGNVGILLGNGDGTFQPAYSFGSGGHYAESAALKDINGDSKPDLIVLNTCSDDLCNSGTASVFLGNGDGSFQPPVGYSLGPQNSSSLVIADINRDGIPDVIAAGSGHTGVTCIEGGLAVLLGNGDGTFQPAIQPVDTCFGPFQGIAVADYDGDGNLDVASLSANVLLLGKGDGSFNSPVVLGTAGYGTVTGDFNHDGKPDLAVASGDVVYVLTNHAAGYRHETVVGLSSSRNPAMLGQTVSFTAMVTPLFSVGALSGTVIFYDGVNVLGTKALVSGQAALTTSALSLGNHAIKVAYSGDTNYLASTSSAVSQAVLLRTTRTTIKSSLNPAMVGDAVTFTATVTSPMGRPPDGGTVTFADGGVVIGSAILASGKAAVSTSFSTAGPHSVTASYLGKTIYSPSTSAALTEKIRAATSTSLVSSANPSFLGRPVTFTATVTSAYGLPGGSVSFRANGVLLGTRSLNGGIAILKISTLEAGTHDVTATFNGSTYFVTSSAGLTQTVQ